MTQTDRESFSAYAGAMLYWCRLCCLYENYCMICRSMIGDSYPTDHMVLAHNSDARALIRVEEGDDRYISISSDLEMHYLIYLRSSIFRQKSQVAFANLSRVPDDFYQFLRLNDYSCIACGNYYDSFPTAIAVTAHLMKCYAT